MIFSNKNILVHKGIIIMLMFIIGEIMIIFNVFIMLRMFSYFFLELVLVIYIIKC